MNHILIKNNVSVTINDSFKNYIYKGEKTFHWHKWETNYNGDFKNYTAVMNKSTSTELHVFYNKGKHNIMLYDCFRQTSDRKTSSCYNLYTYDGTPEDIECYVFDITEPRDSKYGLSIYNADGELIFNSSNEYMKIRDVVRSEYLDENGHPDETKLKEWENQNGIPVGVSFQCSPMYKKGDGFDMWEYPVLGVCLGEKNRRVEDCFIDTYYEHVDAGAIDNDYKKLMVRDLLLVDLSGII